MEQTRDVPLTMPSKRVEGMRLDAEEYDQLVLISRDRAARNGRTLRDELQRTFDRSTYINATPDMRVELVKQVQSDYDALARAALERENPEFAARIAAFRLQRDQLRFGR
jgi:hypothetical protein